MKKQKQSYLDRQLAINKAAFDTVEADKSTFEERKSSIIDGIKMSGARQLHSLNGTIFDVQDEVDASAKKLNELKNQSNLNYDAIHNAAKAHKVATAKLEFFENLKEDLFTENDSSDA